MRSSSPPRSSREAPGRSSRDGKGDGARASRQEPSPNRPAERLRDRRQPVRDADAPPHRVHGAVRAHRERALQPTSLAVGDVRVGAGGRADAGAPPGDRDGDAGAWRAPARGAQGRRQASRRDPQSRRHGRLLHRQDGNADRGAHRAGALRGRKRSHERARSRPRLPQQQLLERRSQPARPRDPRWRQTRRGWLEETRRGPLRLSAAAGFAAARAQWRAPARGQGRAGGGARRLHAIRMPRRPRPGRSMRPSGRRSTASSGASAKKGFASSPWRGAPLPRNRVAQPTRARWFSPAMSPFSTRRSKARAKR